MKVEIDLPKCSKEMFDAFNNHLNKYHLSIGEVLEHFIFAMDCSGRLYDRSQDEAWLAESFFSRAVLDEHLIDFKNYQDFKFYGEIFNEGYLKYISESMAKMKQPEHKKSSDINSNSEEQGNPKNAAFFGPLSQHNLSPNPHVNLSPSSQNNMSPSAQYNLGPNSSQ